MLQLCPPARFLLLASLAVFFCLYICVGRCAFESSEVCCFSSVGVANALQLIARSECTSCSRTITARHTCCLAYANCALSLLTGIRCLSYVCQAYVLSGMHIASFSLLPFTRVCLCLRLCLLSVSVSVSVSVPVPVPVWGGVLRLCL